MSYQGITSLSLSYPTLHLSSRLLPSANNKLLPKFAVCGYAVLSPSQALDGVGEWNGKENTNIWSTEKWRQFSSLGNEQKFLPASIPKLSPRMTMQENRVKCSKVSARFSLSGKFCYSLYSRSRGSKTGKQWTKASCDRKEPEGFQFIRSFIGVYKFQWDEDGTAEDGNRLKVAWEIG